MRQIQDAKKTVSKALPAAAATNASDSIDLTQGGDVPENVEVEITVPALPDLADTKTAIFTVQESSDDGDADAFAAAPWAGALTLTGGGGTGAAAASLRIRPPGNAERYIRLSQAVLADGGDNTAVSATLRLLF